MIMNIIVAVFVLGIAYAWMVRGVFSAMIHAMCVLFGGAIAFALWEPLANLLISVSPERGFASALMSASWGIALLVPFIVSTLALRFATDKLIGANIKSAQAMDYAGGAVFGLASSIISAGILVIAIGHMRVPSNFLGYQPIWYADTDGYLVKQDALWIPVTDITELVYGSASVGAMSTPTPLKVWRPNLEETGFAARISPGDGAGHNTIKRSSFEARSRYTVGNPNGSTERNDIIPEERYNDINDQSVGAAYLEGFVIEFGSEAKETSGDSAGQVIVSNGQVRLLTRHKETGETTTVFPLATISESRVPELYGRWIYDSKDVYITSTGGKSRVPMGFEFLVSADHEPLALYVRQMRVDIEEFGEPEALANAMQRNARVPDGSLLTGSKPDIQYDLSDAAQINPSMTGTGSVVSTSPSLGEMMSSQIAKQRGLTIDDNNLIVSGEAQFLTAEVGRKTVSGRSLQVDEFRIGPGQALVKLQIGDQPREERPVEGGILSEGAKTIAFDEPPVLVDTNGNRYEAVGYVFENSLDDVFAVRFTPGSTISGVSELPAVSRSKTNQKLQALFLVTYGVEIEYFAIGTKVLMDFEPILKTGR